MQVPTYLENVQGGETSNAESENPAIQYIADALEALGYSSWCYRVVASACTGVPNRRKRLFLVASWSADARDILLPQVRASVILPLNTAAVSMSFLMKSESIPFHSLIDASLSSSRTIATRLWTCRQW